MFTQHYEIILFKVRAYIKNIFITKLLQGLNAALAARERNANGSNIEDIKLSQCRSRSKGKNQIDEYHIPDL